MDFRAIMVVIVTWTLSSVAGMAGGTLVILPVAAVQVRHAYTLSDLNPSLVVYVYTRSVTKQKESLIPNDFGKTNFRVETNIFGS